MSCKGTTHAYLYLSQLREDAPIGTDLPVWLTTAANYNDSIPLLNQVIEWGPLTDSWDGFVLLVDDVQRYAGPALNYSLAALNASLPHFFRLAVIIFCVFFPNRRLNIFIVFITRHRGRLYHGSYAVAEWHMGGLSSRTFII